MSASPLTPAERLAQSRAELRALVQPRGQAVAAQSYTPPATTAKATSKATPTDAEQTTTPMPALQTAAVDTGTPLWLSAAQGLLSAWWRRHPVHIALEVGTLLLERTVRQRPLPTLAVAAGLGAALIVLRPWRWRSSRRWAHNQVQREVRSLQPANLARMVLDTLLHNGKPPR